MVGSFSQLAELAGLWAPILYWEQGHEHLFGEGRSSPQLDALFHSVMRQMPIALAAVSNYAQQALARQFGRSAGRIPNGIDGNAFHPPKGSPADPRLSDEEALEAARAFCRVLLVGNPLQAFKGWDVALKALSLLHAKYPSLKVTWVCQSQPMLQGVHFPIDFIVNPPQSSLPSVYRGIHDCLLFASRFEAWGMPVLEAMASGLPVVTSACFGIDDFVVHGRNALVAASHDAAGMAEHMALLFEQPKVCLQLARNGRQTALACGLDVMMGALDDALLRTHDFFLRRCPLPPIVCGAPPPDPPLQVEAHVQTSVACPACPP